MMDDPAFNPDMALPDLGFDLDRALTPQADARSSQSMMSIRRRSGSASSLHASSVLGLDVGSSSGGAGASYQLPQHELFRGSDGKKHVGGNAFEEDELVFEDDDLFDFDADGVMRDIPASVRDARRAASLAPQHRLGSSSVRVRKDQEDVQGHILPIYDADGDFDMQIGDDDFQNLPDAEAFPVMTAAGGNDHPQLSEEKRVPSSPEEEEVSSISAEAPQKRKRATKPRGLKADTVIVLRNSDLNAWQKGYLDNMATQSLIYNNKMGAQQAKANAFHYVYGSGLNGIGQGVGSSKLPSPLDMFSSAALMAKLTRKPLTNTKVNAKGKKRAHPSDEDEDDSTPNKRARDDEIGRGIQDDSNFNLDDDAFLNPNEEDLEPSIELERGRDAPSALPDYPSSAAAAMPWNISASLHSHQRAASSSIHGQNQNRVGSLSRRLTSASPLLGRGSVLPHLDDFDDLMGLDANDAEEMVMYGRSDNGGSSSHIPGLGFSAMGMKSSSHSQIAGGGGVDADEFEIFGAAAGVDTQTAGESQWVRNALDVEGNNFFEFVRNSIDEKDVDELSFGEDDPDLDLDRVGGVDGGGGGGRGGNKSVTFEELFDPEKNSCIVAAQAFYHVLCLATKGRVWVQQEMDEVGTEPWGEILIGVLSV